MMLDSTRKEIQFIDQEEEEEVEDVEEDTLVHQEEDIHLEDTDLDLEAAEDTHLEDIDHDLEIVEDPDPDLQEEVQVPERGADLLVVVLPHLNAAEVRRNDL